MNRCPADKKSSNMSSNVCTTGSKFKSSSRKRCIHRDLLFFQVTHGALSEHSICDFGACQTGNQPEKGTTSKNHAHKHAHLEPILYTQLTPVGPGVHHLAVLPQGVHHLRLRTSDLCLSPKASQPTSQPMNQPTNQSSKSSQPTNEIKLKPNQIKFPPGKPCASSQIKSKQIRSSQSADQPTNQASPSSKSKQSSQFINQSINQPTKPGQPCHTAT